MIHHTKCGMDGLGEFFLGLCTRIARAEQVNDDDA